MYCKLCCSDLKAYAGYKRFVMNYLENVQVKGLSIHWSSSVKTAIYLTRYAAPEVVVLSNFKSHSLPTHETSLITMATLSLPQLYYKHRGRLPRCTSAVFFTGLGYRTQEPLDTITLTVSFILLGSSLHKTKAL